jgi:hypothetical protein
VSPKTLAEILPYFMKKYLPLLIKGRPGVGKELYTLEFSHLEDEDGNREEDPETGEDMSPAPYPRLN